ncbi:pre-mRNA cleavage complex 2 protein Pcf11 [Rhodotorula toruloides]|uniref:Pre-mRNA cleavage complex 2 protein Pcf11 n=1 Tax=Rhodotorula toruloides TaxID=5286 RepID=A0A511KF08_RHOTO|nr:pre-mRNA cleavage complex 2 protein Pcf11 [Rhodotorula toruloides]
MSWYPPPDPYYGYAPPPPAQAAPPPAQPYYGYPPPPPPAAYPSAYPPAPRYDYGPPPPSAYSAYPPAQPAYHHYSSPPPPAPAPPPLKEGELRPPPDVAQDPNSFRRYFTQQLQGLTFNSKPIITSLTLFAHEHVVRMSGVVAQCMEEHLRTCPPHYVLPSFYLLDSISKNIGPPYLALFARFIERVFLSAYHSVDTSTKTKLEELLGTWKTGGADGGELFRMPGEEGEGRVQRGIEGAIFGARGRGDGLGGKTSRGAEMYNAGVQQLPHVATSTERSGVLYDVRRLLSLRQDAATSNPSDQINASQILALKKLESLILNTQLTTEQVNQIRGQLAALAPPPVAQRPSASPVPPPAPSILSPTVQPAASAAYANLLQPPAPAQSTATSGIDLSLLSKLTASGALANLFSPSAASTPPPGIKVEDEGGKKVKVEDETVTKAERDEFASAWEEEIIRLGVGLTNADLLVPRPQALHLLTLSLPLQCNQCGLRLFDSRQGKHKMDQHLDWHFKYKKRMREASGRASGRNWFTREEDWYSSDESHASAADASSSSLTPASSSAPSIDRAALKKQKVPVPAAGSDAANLGLGDKPCPICQDRFKSEWSDEEEEWVWWNATVVDGVLYHATCHAEAALSRAANPSRTATTSVRTSRESTPLASRKRKADSVGPSPIKQEQDAAAGVGEVGRGEEVSAGEEPEAKRIKSEPEVEEAEQQDSLSVGGGRGALFLPEPEPEPEQEAAAVATGEAASTA